MVSAQLKKILQNSIYAIFQSLCALKAFVVLIIYSEFLKMSERLDFTKKYLYVESVRKQ